MSEAKRLADRIEKLTGYNSSELGFKTYRVDEKPNTSAYHDLILIAEGSKDLIVKALRAYCKDRS